MEAKIEEINKEKVGAINGQDFEKAASLRDTEKQTKKELKDLIESWKEATKLLRMEEELREFVIGQDEAVVTISKVLRRSRADIKNPRRAIGSFPSLGPTGVGKTYLARNLAEFIFGDQEALIQIDMSE